MATIDKIAEKRGLQPTKPFTTKVGAFLLLLLLLLLLIVSFFSEERWFDLFLEFVF